MAFTQTKPTNVQSRNERPISIDTGPGSISVRRAWTPSHSQYAGLLLGQNLILLPAFGGFTLLRVNAMDELAEQGRYRSAERETTIAIHGVATEAGYLSHRIAISDQTRAQPADASPYRSGSAICCSTLSGCRPMWRRWESATLRARRWTLQVR